MARHLPARARRFVAPAIVALALLAGLLLGFGASESGAHGLGMAAAAPPVGGEVSGTVDSVDIEFEEDYIAGASDIYLDSPSKQQIRGEVIEVDANELRLEIDPLTEPGPYRVTWQVTSNDGDPARSAYQFTYTGDGPTDGGLPWSQIIWAVIVGAAVVTAIVLLRPRRQPEPEPESAP